MLQVCRASTHWQSIEFVSDLHLSHATPRTVAAFTSYLKHCDADALFVLGDLFEVWIGDDLGATADDAVGAGVLAALQACSQRGVFVGFAHGNRDFLLSHSFLQEHGVALLDDPCTLMAWGRSVVLSHGDALCLADTAYQAFRRTVRAPEWQHGFLSQPRSARARQAREMRDGSQARKHDAAMVTWADADPQATTAWLAAAHADIIIHGHTHRPATHSPAVEGGRANTQRWVLSDWDLDGIHGGEARAEVLRMTVQGIARRVVSA